MPAISFPLAQSKASKRSAELSIIGRVPWAPSSFHDQMQICRPSGAKMQGCPNGRESPAPARETALPVPRISSFTPQPNVQNDTPNPASILPCMPRYCHGLGKERCLYGCDRKGEERGGIAQRRTSKCAAIAMLLNA